MDKSTPSFPAIMHAWIHSRDGRPSSVLSLSSNVAVPSIKEPSDVLVRISHAALNPGASIMMQLCPFFFRSKPAIPELDFSGTIVAAGPSALDSGRVAVGDAVFGSVRVGNHLKEGHGTLAQFVVVPAVNVARKPDRNRTDAEIAGLGVAGCTAMALMEKAGLQHGNSVLVNGASGGIGSMVVQMARDAVGTNGRVVVICSGANAEMIKGLGADEVIDYQSFCPVSTYLAKRFSNQRLNAVIDAYGVRDLYKHSSDYLSANKPFVTVGVAHKEYTYSSMLYAVLTMAINGPTSLLPGYRQRKYVQVNAVVNMEAMEKLRSLVERGKLKVPIDSCWEMDDALEAYERILSRRARGKVIVKIQQD